MRATRICEGVFTIQCSVGKSAIRGIPDYKAVGVVITGIAGGSGHGVSKVR